MTEIQRIERDLDVEFSRLIRSKGSCERCTFTETLQHHHLVGRANKFLRWDIMNGMCLCDGCHAWWHYSKKRGFDWLREKYNGRYIYLMKARHRTVDRTEEDYLRIRSDIKNRNLKGLVMAPDLLT